MWKVPDESILTYTNSNGKNLDLFNVSEDIVLEVIWNTAFKKKRLSSWASHISVVLYKRCSLIHFLLDLEIQIQQKPG